MTISTTTSNLFQPIKLGNIVLKHRVAMAPLTRFRADDAHVPTDLAKTYYEQRASDGGLIITEATFISELAGHYPNVPGIYTADQIEGWKKITKAVHDKGGHIFMQLWFLGRADAIPSVSASAIPIPAEEGKEPKVPRALETSELPGIVDMYRQAAVNAVEAGFDGVEIHGANGYLLDQFLQSNTNHRTDEYGGSAENRSRLVLEVIDAVSSAIGQERTSIRFSPYSHFQDMHDANPHETWSTVTQAIQDRFPKLAYLHFVEARVNGNVDRNDVANSETLEPFHNIWKGVFLRAGGFTLESAVTAANQHENDVLVFGRMFISNPDLPLRLKNGWELTNYNRNTFYNNKSADGYIDYPFYETAKM
ncbi:hypothetical protein K450DRAFT_238239 [Umbelopsis ramanniana AG]|uniref:NADH:flavin oxidoreductase/NADH oxidase N-terminal domain-containing protein n=1 Tax=Umbelopsis ramanniana AG TaxID=1314678 RepID=A0AAD5EAX1_UMBRA|nr:uncharacterized protein K450DRAFT_238239 [Umbelopsis ramanniana AG]KAI8580119.1 hypothetical protein K450DRAFT_238239 [Umbelopsis ramanniana AG]